LIGTSVTNPGASSQAAGSAASRSMLLTRNLWSTVPGTIVNIKQIAPAPKIRIEDASDGLERLRARGAFPVRSGEVWGVRGSDLRRVIKGYFGRSVYHRYQGARHDLENGYLFTNEPDYPSAIASIDGAGGAYVGVGQMLSYTYPAWQGAAHAYNIDLNARVPMVAIPLYGMLLSMASDRFEFLSLISGKPIPKTEQWARLLDGPSDVLVEFIRALPSDLSFEISVQNAVRIYMAGFRALYGVSEMADIALGYLSAFKAGIGSDEPSAHSNVHPISILKAKDAKGRGGTLSSEEQFRRERDIFIDGRITGVASPLEGDGLAAIARDMRRRGIALRAMHISNVEDWFFEDYKRVRRDDPDIDPTEVERNTYNFYRRLKAFNGRHDVRLISALGCYPTMVHDLARYVEQAIPLGEPVEDAVFHAARIFKFRYETSRAMRVPLRDRMGDLTDTLDGDFYYVAKALRRGWRGRPIPRDKAEATLLDRSAHFRETLTDWERAAFLNVLEDIGVIARDDG